MMTPTKCDHCGRCRELIPNRGEKLCDPCLDVALEAERRDRYPPGEVPGDLITSGPFAGMTVGFPVTPRRNR